MLASAVLTQSMRYRQNITLSTPRLLYLRAVRDVRPARVDHPKMRAEIHDKWEAC